MESVRARRLTGSRIVEFGVRCEPLWAYVEVWVREGSWAGYLGLVAMLGWSSATVAFCL